MFKSKPKEDFCLYCGVKPTEECYKENHAIGSIGGVFHLTEYPWSY